jgi:hypothetical protein
VESIDTKATALTAFASVANRYGIFTDTPVFMKTAEAR